MAVAKEIRILNPYARLIYLGEIGGKFNSIAEDSGVFDETHYILSGKFRRYHNESLIRRILDIKTFVLNTIDSLKISIGIGQGILLLRRLKADSVLLKGGSVCIPAGIGARFAKVPTITHDSDALPGVSNRIGGKHSKYHTTAMPAEHYSYPEGKIIHVGLPVSDLFRSYSEPEIDNVKEDFGIPRFSEVLLITGGSNGARRLNNWCAQVIPGLLEARENLYILFVTGKNNIVDVAGDQNQLSRLKMIEFCTRMHDLSAIADVVITRAGATTIAEFAQASKALILVPNPDLTGGHQLKNAKVYQDQESVVVLDEKDISGNPAIIKDTIISLLSDSQLRAKLGSNLRGTITQEPAAKKIAELLLEGRE